MWLEFIAITLDVICPRVFDILDTKALHGNIRTAADWYGLPPFPSASERFTFVLSHYRISSLECRFFEMRIAPLIYSVRAIHHD